MTSGGGKKVLVATNEPALSPGWERGYRHYGWECDYGSRAFLNKTGRYDIVHILWPEEYSDWIDPTPRRLSELESVLKHWSRQSTIICTANNLFPHYVRDRRTAKLLYDLFYRYCDLITHLTETSKRLVIENFDSAKCKRHVVHGQLPYDVTLESQVSRGEKRQALNLKQSDFVVLLFGSIRDQSELNLIKQSVVQSGLESLRLLVVGRAATPTCLTNWWRRLAWNMWLRRNGAVACGFIPEQELADPIDSSDVILVPRIGGLNSAQVMIGMTFGRAMIVPDSPQYLEPIAGTANIIYKTGDAGSLASALREASLIDLKKIGRANAKLARTWTWDRIVGKCLDEMTLIASKECSPGA
ncbi:MAG: hypothetical protein ACR65U_12165 [Methylocystis sp.]